MEQANNPPGDKPAVLCLACRFVNSLVYYGLSLNIGNFGLDIYLTQLVFGAVEIPARFSCIYLMQWFGRKKSQSGCLLLGGIMCLIVTGIPKGTGPSSLPPTLPTCYMPCTSPRHLALRSSSFPSIAELNGDFPQPLTPDVCGLFWGQMDKWFHSRQTEFP